jgi:hypothetical protein
MTEHELHAHAAHIKASVPGLQNHHVQAVHKPGDDRIHFHATPHGQTVTHSLYTPGMTHASTNDPMVAALGAKKRDVHTQYTPETQEHGRGITGTMPIASDRLKNGMTQPELHMHAQAVHRHLVGGQANNVNIHVTHNPGDDHVHFTATPTRVGKHILDPKYHAEPPTIHPTRKHIEKLLTNQHDSNFHANGRSTISGTLPAINYNTKMSPNELEVYAGHALERMAKVNNWTPEYKRGVVVAATHQPGDSRVHFSMAPRGAEKDALDNHFHAGTDPHPGFNQALTNAGHFQERKQNGVDVPWHHAELAALRNSIDSHAQQDQGKTFHQRLDGHVIGVAGGPAGVPPQPCTACHNTLAQLPVEYRGMERDVKDGIQRGKW